MRAAVFKGPGEIEIQTVPEPTPDAGQVRIRLQGCGICASNIPPYEGREWFRYPLEAGSPGHEGWGVIDALGSDVENVRVGDRVAAISGRAYATHDVTDAKNVVRLPTALDGQPFPGEPLACAFNVAERSDFQPGQRVVVIGIGFMGAAVVGLAKAAGAQVIAISRRDSSLELAERMGATHLVRMDDHWRILQEVRDLIGGEGCERVVECVGEQWPLDLAAELTGVRGKLVVAGYHQDGPRQVNMQMWNWRGFDVINAHERDEARYIAGMQAAVDAVAAGRFDPKPLYSHSFGLDQIQTAMEMTRTRPEGFVKALLRFD